MRLSLVVETGDSVRDGAGESVGIGEGSVGKLMLLEVAPASFDVVQLGGIFRQPFEGEPGARGERLCCQLAGVDWPIVENRDQGPGAFGGAVCGAKLVEQGDKIGGALGGAGMDEKAPVHRIKGAEHRPLFRLTGGLDAQLGAAPGPAARQIGMCERFGFVEEHQIDRPRRGLGFQISEALAAGRDRGCILAPFERVARPPPGKPLWRNWCESHRGEIVGPPRRAISAQRRGSVQPLSWRVSSVRIVAAIAAACGPILACCPGRGRRRSPATPPCAKKPRQLRTVLMCTPRTAAISSARRPYRVSRIASARSASPRSSDFARARNPACSAPSPGSFDFPGICDLRNPHPRKIIHSIAHSQTVCLALAPVFGSALFFVIVAASCILMQEKQEPETKKLGCFCPTSHQNPKPFVYPRRTEQT